MNPDKTSEILDATFRVNEFGESVCSSGLAHTTGDRDGDDTQDSEAFSTIGRYQVIGRLGKGGFGVVFKGFDEQLARPVAIKIPQLRRQKEKQQQEGFLQEARELAKLSHAGIVAVYDVGIDSERCYIVTEFLEGENLHCWLRSHKPSWSESVAIVAKIADALAHAHAMMTVHRDVKPANILMVNRPEGLRPVLVDFGLALSNISDVSKGAITGTPNYMSPEQARGDESEIDGRTDIYSLGVVLYLMLTRRLPYSSQRASEVLQQVLHQAPIPVRQHKPSVPEAIESICQKAMAKNRRDRYATAIDFAQALREQLDSQNLESVPQRTDRSLGPAMASAPDSTLSTSRTSAMQSREAQHRHVTMLACECPYFQSPEFEQLGAQSQRELTDEFLKTCNEAVTQFGGVMAEQSPLRIVACFGFPIAFEDSAMRAVRCGKQLLDCFAARDKPPADNLAVRVAVHAGSVVAASSPQSNCCSLSLVGGDHDLTQRLTEFAELGSLIVTQPVFETLSAFFECSPVGQPTTQDAACAVTVYRVDKQLPCRHKLDLLDPTNLTPLIGRDTELNILRERWEQADEGMGQVVMLIGDAGLGKSRLIRELRQRIQQCNPNAALIEWRCSTFHQNSGLYPAREFFELLLELRREMSADKKLDILVAHLDQYGLASQEVVPLFANLLSIPQDERYPMRDVHPQRLKELTQQALLRWLRAYADKQPVLFTIEDLHWIDPSTLELLGLLIAEGFQQRILTVMTFRPDFSTPWTSAAHQTQIALNRLTRRQVGQMMCQQSGIKNFADELIDQIVKRTDGVPLFVEEYTRVIRDADELQDTGGSVNLSTTDVLASIPTSLKDLLFSRLDCLGSLPDVVQMAATLGREFGYDVLRAASGLPDAQLRFEVDKLLKGEVLFQEGVGDVAKLIFKHALIQDAAYDSLIKSKRRRFHRSIARTLERQFPEYRQTQPELIAHHYQKAGDLERSIKFYVKAGSLAQSRFANLEATDHFQAALKLLDKLPPSPERDGMELQIKLPLSAVLMGAQGYAAPAVGPIQDRAIEICRQLKTPRLFGVLEANWAFLFIGAKFDQAYERAYELIRIAEESGQAGQLTEAYWTLACTATYNGDYATALTHAEKSFATWDRDISKEYARVTQQNSGPLALTHIGLTQWKTGHVDSAAQHSRRACELALEIDDIFTHAITQWKLGQIGEFSGDGHWAYHHGSQCVRIAKEQSFAWWIAIGTCCQGVGLHLMGDHRAAIDALRQGLAMNQATGARILAVKYGMWLAVALWHDAQRSEAWQVMNDTFIEMEKGEQAEAAEMNRFRGDFLYDDGDLDQAAIWYHKAIEIAQRQGAKSFQLRALLRLCRIWKQQGHNGPICDQLGPLYDSFAEGFQTPDLITAQSYLNGT